MNTILFDLDGTLLPMDQEHFVNLYFKALASHLAPSGIPIQNLMDAVNGGMNAMIQNDGDKTNEERFWDAFSSVLGNDIRKMEPDFMNFYETSFHQAKESTCVSPYAKDAISLLKQKGYHIVLATNPVFPPIATHGRIRWAGLDPADFERITTYDNSSYCKPNLAYYREILTVIGKRPDECMMVGNDVEEDMVAGNLGLSTFLITDCMINRKNLSFDKIRHGDFKAFYDFVAQLPDAEE
ncbi:MAG: HAD family hydrolase [Lachnospiraceae bacterium]|nr:HAD family hydrolase [Lachnospiraceae bacterium]